MRSKILLFSVFSLILFGAGCAAPEPQPTPTPVPSAPVPSEPATPITDSTSTNSLISAPPVTTLAFPGIRPAAELTKKVRIKTTLGDIVIQVDPKAGPLAASNFVYLIEQGFYNGTIFHRVIDGFMIQGGDPTGTGRGGPGYQFDNDSVTTLPTRQVTDRNGNPVTLASYKKGTVAMANAGQDTNGSQFFIMVSDVEMPAAYSVFGTVIEGQDVADKISLVERSNPGVEDRPITEVKMVSVGVE